MRVIAGSAGGIPLRLPKTDLRPTMDMVRGAVFSSLGDACLGKHVLDLFAGCGSMGIEAMSRGAASAILVDADRKACACIEQNLEKTRLKASVICSDVFRFLKTQPRTMSVDIIFADPPYAKRPEDRDFASELLRDANLPHMLHSDGVMILEIATAWKCPDLKFWEPLKRRKYGSTEILFLRRISAMDASCPGTERASRVQEGA